MPPLPQQGHTRGRRKVGAFRREDSPRCAACRTRRHPYPSLPRKHAKEVFVDAAENVVSPMIAVRTETDGADEVNELTEHLILEVLTTVVAGQDACQCGVFAFDESHCLVNGLTDSWQLGLGLQLLPAGTIRNPEDVLTRVFVPIFQE